MSDDSKRHVRYPNHYAWLIFVAAMDIFMTYLILHFGGGEANPLGRGVIDRFGVPGMTIFKLGLIALAIVIAEEVGRRDHRKGRRFVEYAIVISAFPVILAFALIWNHG